MGCFWLLFQVPNRIRPDLEITIHGSGHSPFSKMFKRSNLFTQLINPCPKSQSQLVALPQMFELPQFPHRSLILAAVKATHLLCTPSLFATLEGYFVGSMVVSSWTHGKIREENMVAWAKVHFKKWNLSFYEHPMCVFFCAALAILEACPKIHVISGRKSRHPDCRKTLYFFWEWYP